MTKAPYSKRNEVERLFRRLKGLRRIFSRFDKRDVVFLFLLQVALVMDSLIAARFGCPGIAGTATQIAWILFVLKPAAAVV
jgi:uncharacterized membrane protein YtjA (UPF0391 family)